jgi:hypothetical protein
MKQKCICGGNKTGFPLTAHAGNCPMFKPIAPEQSDMNKKIDKLLVKNYKAKEKYDCKPSQKCICRHVTTTQGSWIEANGDCPVHYPKPLEQKSYNGTPINYGSTTLEQKCGCNEELRQYCEKHYMEMYGCKPVKSTWEETTAMNIVYQIGDLLSFNIPTSIVDARQKTNDKAIDFVKKILIDFRLAERKEMASKMIDTVVKINEMQFPNEGLRRKVLSALSDCLEILK